MLPAYAGMIRLACLSELVDRRAPRVCGDDPPRLAAAFLFATVLPAYAGMIPGCEEAAGTKPSAPRVCGDDPPHHHPHHHHPECSPRMRG